MSTSQPLVLTDPNLLAEFVRESDLRGMFEKRFAAPPDLGAILFRNGQLVNAYKGAHFSVGGIMNAIKGVVGGSQHISIMLMDLKPFQIQLPVYGTSRDKVAIAGLATLELQLNPEKPSNVLGLMSGVSRSTEIEEYNESTGRRALSRTDVLDRIAPHFSDRVVEAAVGRLDAEDIRGNVGFQDKIQADMMLEAERICGDIGLLVRAVSVEWALNDVELEAFQKAKIQRQQQGFDEQLELLKREVARQGEATEVQIRANVDKARLEGASEDELAHMVLNSEISFIDARETATRVQEMKALAHEIELLRTERAAKVENELAEASHLTDLTAESARMRVIERQIELLDAQHISEMKKIGAFTDIEIQDRTERMELERAKIAAEQSQSNLRAMMDIDHSGKDRDTDRDIRSDKARTDNEIALKRADSDGLAKRFEVAGNLTPEQIMAINAGMSPEVAEVLKEQARAQAGAGQSSMDMMRQLIQDAKQERAESREHELNILKAGMGGATGVAHGAGGKPPAPDAGEADANPTQVECPKCGRTNPAKNRFCTGCGTQLRA